jgi:hypothetical protein
MFSKEKKLKHHVTYLLSDWQLDEKWMKNGLVYDS